MKNNVGNKIGFLDFFFMFFCLMFVLLSCGLLFFFYGLDWDNIKSFIICWEF